MESSTDPAAVPAPAAPLTQEALPPPQEIVNLVDRHTARIHTMMYSIGCVPPADFDQQCHDIAMSYVTDESFDESKAWNAMLDLIDEAIPKTHQAQFAWRLVRKTMAGR